MPCPVDQRPIFNRLMLVTKGCVANGEHKNSVHCEVAYLSKGKEFSWHTHPEGTRTPSDIDKKTTARHGKEYLCIGLVPQGRTVCYHKSDNYTKPVCEF